MKKTCKIIFLVLCILFVTGCVYDACNRDKRGIHNFLVKEGIVDKNDKLVDNCVMRIGVSGLDGGHTKNINVEVYSDNNGDLYAIDYTYEEDKLLSTTFDVEVREAVLSIDDFKQQEMIEDHIGNKSYNQCGKYYIRKVSTIKEDAEGNSIKNSKGEYEYIRGGRHFIIKKTKVINQYRVINEVNSTI